MASNGPAHPVVRRVLQRLLLSSILLQSLLLALSQAQLTARWQSGAAGAHWRGRTTASAPSWGRSAAAICFTALASSMCPPGAARPSPGPTPSPIFVSRVTGGQQSVIDGLLRSEILGANLFLLNPSGVLFGPNASLDVSGSFHVSTADFLRFADGAKFFANLGQESVLTVASPAAFGFLGSNPARIAIQGSSLQVREGKALSVVGGDITDRGNGPSRDSS